jgi:hypothetical protein
MPDEQPVTRIDFSGMWYKLLLHIRVANDSLQLFCSTRTAAVWHCALNPNEKCLNAVSALH